MERWIKSAVMGTVIVIWAVFMLVGIGKYLFSDVPMPDPAIWGIPGMVWLALNPPAIFGSHKKDRDTRETE